jgi:hypothetical protein
MRKLKTQIHGVPAGQAPLGHAPGAKIKLEGPKRHHDNHGPNASVPAKGNSRIPSEEHWEMQYKSDPSKDTVKRMGSEFDARPSRSRMTTHVKVNECDH